MRRQDGGWHRPAILTGRAMAYVEKPGMRFPDRFRTHCHGLAGSGLPPTPPKKKKGEQSGARSWRRCRRPASTLSWCRPLDTTPHPTNGGAIPVAPDWLNAIATNDPHKKRNLVVLVCHDFLATSILTVTFCRRPSSGAIGLPADFGIGQSPGHEAGVNGTAPGHAGAGS